MSAKPDNIEKAIDQALHMLGEHFEHVQVLATRTIEGRTHSVARGVGNWHARQGMAHEFITQENAQEMANHIAELIKPDEGE